MYFNEQQTKRASAIALDELCRSLNQKSAIAALERESGLTGCAFLYGEYQREFGEIGSQSYVFDDDKLKGFVALMGLVMGRFFDVDLPTPKRLLVNEYTPQSYNLGYIEPWDRMYIRNCYEGFEGYINDWEKIQAKRFKVDYREEDLPEEWSQSFKIASRITDNFLAKITDFLRPLRGAAATLEEVVKRDVELRQLISETERYPVSLKSVMYWKLKDPLKELKADDPFKSFMIENLLNVLYGDHFDNEKFRKGTINLYWDKLNGLVKDKGQKKVLEIIRSEVTALLETEDKTNA